MTAIINSRAAVSQPASEQPGQAEDVRLLWRVAWLLGCAARRRLGC